jgi:hypothetical protein
VHRHADRLRARQTAGADSDPDSNVGPRTS